MFYGIQIPKPKDGQDPNRRPTAEELCSAYSSNINMFILFNQLLSCFKLFNKSI